MYDKEFLKFAEKSRNIIIPWFLMASYAYYHLDKSIISDGLYDKMAKAILKHWNIIQHRHKNLITKTDLKAGSLYRLREDEYPSLTKDSVKVLIREMK